jgi:hypothetical protein
VPPILFLDVDGVLVPDRQDAPATTQFHLACVEVFRSVLVAVPGVRVVFSTTWRLPQHVKRLHEQWTAHGFPLALAMDGTPDLRGDVTVSRLHRRGLEIRAWLDAHPAVDRWVVLDDERMGIEPILGDARCVFTNPARGLTADDAERAVGILRV